MVEIQALTDKDLEDLVELNNGALPHVNELNLASAAELLGQTSYGVKVLVSGSFAGFLLVLEPGQPYQSVNYRWFSDQYDQFAYVDRIIVAPSSRGLGLGGKLYGDLVRFCRVEGIPRVTCEVNIKPPNPGSSAFHENFGFVSVGTQMTEGGAKQVDLLAMELR